MGCVKCESTCPTSAITFVSGNLEIDRGQCIACGECVDSCPTGAIESDRSTRVAALTREDLILRKPELALHKKEPLPGQFRNSLHVREVSTGDPASDLEVSASDNPIFDGSRFGIHVVASPRFADALVITGPVGRAMQEPLLRCYEAMATPRLVVAVGAAAISGAPYFGGYAGANGVSAVLPVDVFVPGNPPHPWYILHGLMLGMGHKALGMKRW